MAERKKRLHKPDAVKPRKTRHRKERKITKEIRDKLLDEKAIPPTFQECDYVTVLDDKTNSGKDAKPGRRTDVIARANTPLSVPATPEAAASPCESIEKLEMADTHPVATEPKAVQKKARLVYIEDDFALMETLCQLLENVCEIPEGLTNTTRLEQAIERVKTLEPDILVTDGHFDDDNPDACLELLDFTKINSPKTKVILFSAVTDRFEKGSDKFKFDAIATKPDIIRVLSIIKDFQNKV